MHVKQFGVGVERFDAQKLQERVKIGGCVYNWSAGQTPRVSAGECEAGLELVGFHVADNMSFVQYNAMPLHSLEDTTSGASSFL